MFPRKRSLIVLVAVMVLAMTACAANNQSQNILAQTSAALDPVVETLAMDWPKASGLIRGVIGVHRLPQEITAPMDEIDAWWKNPDGTWKESITLSTYQKWYIAGVRYSHTGKLLRVYVEVYAPGLLLIPETLTVLSFLGL
jgi:hypothetical protein